MAGGKTLTQQAFLVSIENAGESDGFARFFCRELGAVAARVRGMRKQTSKMGPALKQADELELRLSGEGSVKILSGVRTRYDHGQWRRAVDRMSLAWFMHECAYVSASDEQTNGLAFRLIANIMRASPTDAMMPAAVTVFCLKFLSIHGLQPDLETCIVDGHQLAEDEPVHLAPSCEGLVGREGYNSRYGRGNSPAPVLNHANYRIWQHIYATSIGEALMLDCDTDCAALAVYSTTTLLQNSMGQRIKSAEFIARQWAMDLQPDFS